MRPLIPGADGWSHVIPFLPGGPGERTGCGENLRAVRGLVGRPEEAEAVNSGAGSCRA